MRNSQGISAHGANSVRLKARVPYLCVFENCLHTFRPMSQYFNLFMNSPLDVDSNVIQSIVKDNDIDLIIHNLNWDITQSEDIVKLTPDYINALEGAIEHSNIPIVGVLESYNMSYGLSQFADVIVKMYDRIQEYGRFLVICEKPEKLFDPFFLYEDGSFVYEKDSLNSDIMNSIGKEIIHPEE